MKERVKESDKQHVQTGLSQIGQDFSHGLRQFRRLRSVTVVCVLSLAIGIAATTAVFSSVVNVIWSLYPYANTDRMANCTILDEAGHHSPLQLPAGQFRELRSADFLDDAIIWDNWDMSTRNEGLPETVRVGHFSPNAFRYYGVAPLIGQGFSADTAFGSAPAHTAVLSYPYWRSRFNGSPTALGTVIKLDREDYTVVGVLPDRFAALDVDLYVPLAMTNDLSRIYTVGLRLKPNVTDKEAAGRLRLLLNRFALQTPRHFPHNFNTSVQFLNDEVKEKFGGTLTGVFAAATLLLIVACVNVSILLIVRGTARRQELAVRAALGASAVRIVRQLLAEAVGLSMAGGIAGVAASYLIVYSIARLLPPGFLPRQTHLHVSLPALVFALLIAITCGVLSGIFPAMRLSRGSGSSGMRFKARGSAGGESRRLHFVLVAVQVCTTMLLVSGASAAGLTTISLMRTRLGYSPANVVSLGISLQEGTFTQWPARTQYYAELVNRVSTIPGVDAVGLTVTPLPPISRVMTQFRIRGAEDAPRSATLQVVSPELFTALEIPVVGGRLWTKSEVNRAAAFLVINQSMQRRYWRAENPIGKVISVDGLRSGNIWTLEAPGNTGTAEIIGIVGDTPNDGLLKPPLPTVYIPYTLLTPDSIQLIVRTKGSSEGFMLAVQKEVVQVNPEQPVNPVIGAQDRLETAGWGRERFLAALFNVIGLFGLILAGVGIYSVVSYSTSMRSKELAVRVAVGASWMDILWTASGSVLGAVCVGLVLGALLTAAVSGVVLRWVGAGLFSVPVLASATAILLPLSLLSSLVPAYRAATANPMEPLREND